MRHSEIVELLCARSPDVVHDLFARGHALRLEEQGHEVLTRAILEVSSHCRAQCHYCGLRRGNGRLPRYRLDDDVVVQAARDAHAEGHNALVLQGGEDPSLTCARITALLTRLGAALPAAVTLSLGERSPATYARWRDAGAARYLLKFETSNPSLYARLRHGRQLRMRLRSLDHLRALGYRVGSGNIVGLPGQTIADLAADLALMASLELGMIAIGPFIAHPHTPLAGPAMPRTGARTADTLAQACDAADLTLRSVAIARLMVPKAWIPATTALEVLRPGARALALQAGANVLMFDRTPAPYRARYEIYPGRRRVTDAELERTHG